MEEINISGDLVTLRSVQTLKQISVEDLLGSLQASAGLRTPILPEGVIYYAAKNSKRLYVRCRKPGPVTLNWKIVKKDETTLQSTVKLPWVYFFHTYTGNAFEDLYVFCSADRIEDAGETLCRLPIKNQGSNCSICLGSDLKFGLDGRMSGKLARVEDHFWNSTFNSDLEDNFYESCPDWLTAAGKDDEDPFIAWERLSADAAFDPCKVEWVRYRKWSEIVDTILGGA